MGPVWAVAFDRHGRLFSDGIAGPDRQRTWQVYLINFLFWSGIAFSATVFVAILNITNARWGRPLKRLAEALGAFTPVAFLLFWVLYFGSESIFPWVNDPVQGKESWLNTVSLFARNGIGLFLLTGVCAALIYCSVRGISSRSPGKPVQVEGPSGRAFERSLLACSGHPLPHFVDLFCFVLSLVAFDLVMSLDPHWTSTLFEGCYFYRKFLQRPCRADPSFRPLVSVYRSGYGNQQDSSPRHFTISENSFLASVL